ncbi:MAG: hypothetical protein J0L91_09420 [Burkholderiales bacterium]|nr:hypothetical protein [Burkholderiales bacterium]MCC7115185.1 hypothetical protein [Burkholderiales bacterium]
MDAYAPDLSAYWCATHDDGSGHLDSREERPNSADEQAWVELVERVSAARSVV